MANPTLASHLYYTASNVYNRLSNFSYRDMCYVIDNEVQSLKYDGRDVTALYNQFLSAINSIVNTQIAEVNGYIATTFTEFKNSISDKKQKYDKLKRLSQIFIAKYPKEIVPLLEDGKWAECLTRLDALEKQCNDIITLADNPNTKSAYQKIYETALYCYDKVVRADCESKDIGTYLTKYRQRAESYCQAFGVAKTDAYVAEHLKTYAVCKMKNAALLGVELQRNGKIEELFTLSNEAMEDGRTYNSKHYKEGAEYAKVLKMWADSINVLFDKAAKDLDIARIQVFLECSEKVDDKSIFTHTFLQRDSKYKGKSAKAISALRSFEFVLEYLKQYDYGKVKGAFKLFNQIAKDPAKWEIKADDKKKVYNLWALTFLNNEKRNKSIDCDMVFSFYGGDVFYALIDAIFELFGQKEYSPSKETLVAFSENFLSKQNLEQVDAVEFMRFAMRYVDCHEQTLGDTAAIKKSKYDYAKGVDDDLKLYVLTAAIFRSSKGLKQMTSLDASTQSKFLASYYSAYKTLFGSETKELNLKAGQSVKSVALNLAKARVVSDVRRERAVMAVHVGVVGVFGIIDAIFIALLFSQAKFDWYFQVPQALRIILDIVWVALHIVYIVVFFLKAGKMTIGRFFATQVVSTTILSLLAATMIAVFSASYATTVQQSYEDPIQISSADDINKIKNMPYCGFELVNDIYLEQTNLVTEEKNSRTDRKFSYWIPYFYGKFNGNGFCIELGEKGCLFKKINGATVENVYIIGYLYSTMSIMETYMTNGELSDGTYMECKPYSYSSFFYEKNTIRDVVAYFNEPHASGSNYKYSNTVNVLYGVDVNDTNRMPIVIIQPIGVYDCFDYKEQNFYRYDGFDHIYYRFDSNFTITDDLEYRKLFVGGKPEDSEKYYDAVYFFINDVDNISKDDNGNAMHNYWKYSYFKSKSDFQIIYINKGEDSWNVTSDAVCFD